jgi:alpha/beta superfamily hydrolase
LCLPLAFFPAVRTLRLFYRYPADWPPFQLQEVPLKIPISHGHLEAVLRDPEGDLRGGAVLCHPHPLHGGTMNTKAVYRASQALNQVGFRTLRFNFRGVGCSTGTFDDGYGEREDVSAALDWLELSTRTLPLVVAGVSFGSMVGLGVGVEDPRVVALVGMAAPVLAYDYSYLGGTQKPVLVVQGEHDEFGSAAEAERILGLLGEHVMVRSVAGAGHLFAGHLEELQATIQDYFTIGPGSAPFRS